MHGRKNCNTLYKCDDRYKHFHTQSRMGIFYTTSPVQPVDDTETAITVVFPEVTYKFVADSARQCKMMQPVDESEATIIVVFSNSETHPIEMYEPQKKR